MAYQALYNKYRPQTFKDVVGQKNIVLTLQNAIKEDKVCHAYLFCGPRGTGKTTMARLFAKALNCLNGTGEQCNSCDSCVKITQGNHPDVIELDAASNSSVDDVRTIVDNLSFRPILSKYKIYIIDEVHNMSNEAFNALLKSIEEPPDFVIFILATTDPQKLIPTILSRVQRYDFSKVNDDDLVSNMERILKSENIEYEKEALVSIAEMSDGGVRDSLSLLDKVVSYCSDKITLKDVEELLGILSKKDLLSIVDLIHKKDAANMIKMVRDKYKKGMDLNILQKNLLYIYKDYLIYKMTNDFSLVQHLDKKSIDGLDIPIYEAKKASDIIIKSMRDNKLTDDPLTQFELALVSLTNESVPIQQEEPKEALKGKKKEVEATNQTISLVQSKGSGIAFKKDEPINNEELISYSKDQILYLMDRADKDKRIVIDKSWQILKDATKFQGNLPMNLLHCKAKIFSNNILVVSNPSLNIVNKINKKSEQAKIKSILKEAFNIESNCIAILDSDYKLLTDDYRNGKRIDKFGKIDFGDDKVSSSQQFLDDLLNKGE